MSILQNAMTTDRGINYTNMVLMVLSAALSFLFPFQLFLLAYAVLGPLHYLTEMSWLEKRNFFIEKKTDVWLYVLMSVLLTVPAFFPAARVGQYGTTFLMIAVAFTLIIFFAKNQVFKYVLTLMSAAIIYGIKADENHSLFFWFAIMLPTIIHVFIFTGLFIIFGALKSKSKTGLISILVLIACTASLFLLLPPENIVVVGEEVQKPLGNFVIVNKALIMLFGLDSSVTSLVDAFNIPNLQLFSTPAAILVARFIAFAYTYHYLNWFSKTTVIKWHEVPKKRMIIILLLWVGAVASYMIDYNFGFKVLFLFSMMHVLLEFPLNFVTIRGIGKELITRISRT